MKLENTSTEQIISIREQQKAYFASEATLDLNFRKNMLRKFLSAMEKWEGKLSDALWTDLHKSYEEANQKAIISLEKKLTKAFDEHFIEGVSLK